MAKACFCGTFDPFTLGHLDVVKRASDIFEEVVVVICENSEKKTMFSLQQRLDWIDAACVALPNVRCSTYPGLAVDACRSEGATVMLRGIRNMIDFEYEHNMAAMNRKLADEIETVCLFTDKQYMFCSSSNVREMIRHGADVSDMVPAVIAREVRL